VKEAPRETLWLGTIAELTRNKGLSYLIEALALLKKKGHDLTTVIIGRGEERANLEALVARHGLSEHVHFAGFVPNANTYLRAFDLFVLPSVKEGLPYVLLEAGQAACAVVGSNISGVTDIIDNDTGLRFPPKDAGALADALLKLITDRHLREKLGDALNEKVAREFSRERMFTETEKIYARSN
jgi:glycosyltransferase involved in cell wall biosynthesis